MPRDRVWKLLPLVALITVYWLSLTYQLPNSGDEPIDVLAGQQLLQGKGAGQLTLGHPVVGAYFIALSLLAFGSPRVVGGILASLTFVLLFRYLDKKSGKEIAMGVSILIVANPLFMKVMSLAMLEVYWVCFALLGFLAVSIGERKWLAIGALLFGLSLGSKWSALPFLASAAIYVAISNRRRIGLLPVLLIVVGVVYLGSNAGLIRDLGWTGFLANQLASITGHESGVGAGVIYGTSYKDLVAPLMTFLGFTNALYLAPYVPHLFLFNTYWYLTYLLNPALWIMTLPSLAIVLHRYKKKRNVTDLMWLLWFLAGLSVIYLTPKFFTFYFDGLSVALAYLIASSIPARIRIPYYVLVVLLPILLYYSPFNVT